MNTALVIAVVFYFLGVFSPLVTTTKFIIFSETVSLWTALVKLARGGEIFLFVVIGTFSVLFPAAKLAILSLAWNSRRRPKHRHTSHLHWIDKLGKWSMLDVFVVALFLVSVKLGAIADVEVHYGVVFFALSIIITMIVTPRVRAHVHLEMDSAHHAEAAAESATERGAT